MDWDHLRVFLAVARKGQLLGAARALGLNHTTVARRLDALEADMGATLFERRPSGSALTPAGERLVPVAERMETELLQLASSMRAGEAEVAGPVRIGAPDGLGNLLLAAELGAFAERHPGLAIELVPLPRTFSLSRREADIAIGLDRPTHGRLIAAKLGDYSLGVYAAPAYLARAGTPETREALSRHAVVTGVEDFLYAAALDYATALEDGAGRLFRCASVVGQMEAIRAGAGIGVLHDFAAAGDPGLVRVLPEISFRRAYWMMSHADTHGAARIATCRAFLASLFRERRVRFLPYEGG
ncbi:LysR family transcriptional regulator [Methylopila turkensis]|uniref:LysR family transcriptional regulator n=1 Tax=Methylopila turkensis TaxID=1437816 RepID=A0A9W6JQ12_9HYPH|nr:LysR family transcriptional regulator [Methylopila turkensis]GLK79523.1 LysR family transcriptional regulator [Methylopila turkensis]